MESKKPDLSKYANAPKYNVTEEQIMACKYSKSDKNL